MIDRHQSYGVGSDPRGGDRLESRTIGGCVRLAAVIAVEKLWRHGETFARVFGVAHLVCALLVVFEPGLAPGLDPAGVGHMDDMGDGHREPLDAEELVDRWHQPAGGPPSAPESTAVNASVCWSVALSLTIKPTFQLPSGISAGVCTIMMQVVPDTSTTSTDPASARWIRAGEVRPIVGKRCGLRTVRSMATLLAHITVRPGTERDFEAIARELHDATHATETGVRHYDYWRGAEPRTYYTLLSFDDHRTFVAHQTSDHHEEASPRIGQVVESIRLEWVDPVDGASDLPPTEHQVAPADADELTSKYTDQYAARVAEWWSIVRGAS